MKKNNLKRFLASLLAVLMLSQVTGVAPGVFAAGNDAAAQSEEAAAPVFQEYTGEVLIKGTYGSDEILDALATAFVENKDSVDISAINWTYKCAVKGTYKLIKTHETNEVREAVVPVLTGETYKNPKYVYDKGLFGNDKTAEATYVYPALKDVADGTYELYANGVSVGTINKVAKLKSAINVNNEVATIAIPYTSGTEYDVNALNESIFNAYVTSTTPAGLTYDKLSYNGTIAEGQQTITISYAGDEDHYGANAPVTVNFVDDRIDTFSLKDRPENLSIGYKGAFPDEAESLANVRKQLVNQLADIDLNAVKVEYDAGILGVHELTIEWIVTHMLVSTDIKLTYAGDATHKPFTAIVKDIKFADNRVASSIAIKEGASITFNMSADNMKEQIFNNAIDWDASELPAKETLSINDFKFEWKTLPEFTDKLPLDKDKLEKYKAFAPIEGGKGCEVINAAFDCPRMGAGDQTIQIKFNGDSEFKPGNVEGALKVEKANVTVTINDPIKVIYAGEKIDAKNYVSTDPADPALEIYIVYVGVNTSKESTIYLQVSGEKQNFIDGISDFQKEYLKYEEEDTLRGKLNDGITVGEFKEMLNGVLSYVDNDLTKFIVNAMLNKYGLTYDNLKDLLEALDKVGIADNLRLAIGSPAHAGQYFAVAIAVNDNYNTGVSLPGSVTVLKNWKNVKLAKNPLFDAANNTITAKDNTITVSQAKEIANSVCILTKDGEELDNSQTSVHYLFTGVNKIYAKNVMPTAPGKYIVTASVRGGDFFALPKTFSFTIVADPATEA